MSTQGDKLKAIADAIREADGTDEPIVANDFPDRIRSISPGVKSFNGRTGDVVPAEGDYTAEQVGAVPTSRKVNGKILNTDITLSAKDVNAHPLTWVPTASGVGALPISEIKTGVATISSIEHATFTSGQIKYIIIGKAVFLGFKYIMSVYEYNSTTSTIQIGGVPMSNVTESWYGIAQKRLDSNTEPVRCIIQRYSSSDLLRMQVLGASSESFKSGNSYEMCGSIAYFSI